MQTMLGNINLYVRDIEKSRRFYSDIMGLVEDRERCFPPSFILFNAGGCTLTLQDGSSPRAVF